MKSSWMVNHLCSHSFPLEITWRAIISHPHIGKIYVSNKVEGWNKPLQQQVTQLCPTLCNPMGLYSPWNSPGQNTRVDSYSLLQGIFPIQGSNSGLLHCRWILYQLSHKGSPRVLEWVAYPFSSRSSRPRNQTKICCITGRFFTSWATRESPNTNQNGAILAQNQTYGWE